MTSSYSSPYCRVPWTSISVQPNGDVIPCCATSPSDQGIIGNLKSDTFEEIWTSDKAINFREAHLGDISKFSPCNLCYDYESQGKLNRKDMIEKKYGKDLDSLNIDYQKTSNPPFIQLLDIAFSPLCNLSCTMCSTRFSSSWVETQRELSALGFPLNVKETALDGFNKFRSNLESIFPYFDGLNTVLLKGGEPLLSKDCLWFLSELVNRGLSNNIDLKIVTNGTILNNQIQDLFTQFRLVEVVISLDAINDLYSYIRGGSKFPFELVHSNIQKFQKFDGNVRVVLSPTLMAYNAFQFYELIQYSYNNSNELFFNNWVIEPQYQSVASLPKELFPEVIDQLQKSLDFIKTNQPNNKSLYMLEYIISYLKEEIPWLKAHSNYKSFNEKLFEFTAAMDKYRGMEASKLIPQLAPYL